MTGFAVEVIVVPNVNYQQRNFPALFKTVNHAVNITD
jgi:hypothetical protein